MLCQSRFTYAEAYTISMTKFVHLHVHSHYSLLQALPKIPDLVAAAKAQGCTALALTDRNNLYGAIEFYRECESTGIKPIIGLDTSLDTGFRLVLLAENETGYKNLIKIVTASQLSESSTTIETLKKHAAGLIAIVPSLQGEVATALRADDNAKATRLINAYKKIFGAKNVYLEGSSHEEIDGHDDLMESTLAFAKKEKVSIVAGQEVFYLRPEDRRAWITMRAIEQRGPAENGDIGSDEEDFSFRSAKDMERMFAKAPEVLATTLEIAKRCELKLELGSWVFPQFPIPAQSSYEQELQALIENGIRERNTEDTPELRERIAYEYK